MNARFSQSVLIAAIVFGCALPARADEKPKQPPTQPPAETELRASITRGLTFLAKDGEAWMKSKDRNGCHHLPELLWSHREAMQRGFAVNETDFDRWLAWAEERAKDKKPGTEMMALMRLALPDRPMPDLAKVILESQQADGSWKPAGQFADMQKRGAQDAQANSTRVFLIAAAAESHTSADPQIAQSEADAAYKKAMSVLAKKDAPTTTESLVFRLLFALRYDPLADRAVLRDQILKQQRGDGGWSFFIGENMSDPLATGQALYVLQSSSSEPKTAEAIARAQLWLLKTQREDGSWPTDITHLSKVDRSAPAKAKSLKDATAIYTYYGSGWATIGLLQAVPRKEDPAQQAAAAR